MVLNAPVAMAQGLSQPLYFRESESYDSITGFAVADLTFVRASCLLLSHPSWCLLPVLMRSVGRVCVRRAGHRA